MPTSVIKAMPAKVIKDVPGSEFPADWDQKYNVDPNELYCLTVQPQSDYEFRKKITGKLNINNESTSRTILENIPGSTIPIAWREEMKADPKECFAVRIEPQKEYRSLKEIMDEISDKAQARGMTPEILADILGVSVEEIS